MPSSASRLAHAQNSARRSARDISPSFKEGGGSVALPRTGALGDNQTSPGSDASSYGGRESNTDGRETPDRDILPSGDGESAPEDQEEDGAASGAGKNIAQAKKWIKILKILALLQPIILPLLFIFGLILIGVAAACSTPGIAELAC